MKHRREMGAQLAPASPSLCHQPERSTSWADARRWAEGSEPENGYGARVLTCNMDAWAE